MTDFEAFPGPTSCRFATIRSVTETGSTNSDILTAAKNGAPEGEVLMAKRQTNGKGRQGRRWVGDSGDSMMMSFLVRPIGYEPGLLPLAAGLAVVRAVGALGPKVALKWPNDVLAPAHGERKLAGILAESGSHDQGFFAVVGIGLNLRLSPEQRIELGGVAIDLSELTSEVPSSREMALLVLAEMESLLGRLEKGHSLSVVDDYRQSCLSLGRQARFESATGPLAGRVDSISDDGSLVLDTPEGLRPFTAGDLHHLG